MNYIVRTALAGAAAFFLALATTGAQTIVYDSIDTTATSGYSLPNSSNPIFGDTLNLSQGGTLSSITLSIFNSSSSGNTGTITNGTMLVRFYDNTVPYSGGTMSLPLLGQTNLPYSFPDGLTAGFFSTDTWDLTPLHITVPTNILVTQQFTQTYGNSTRNGVVLFSDPIIGSSPANVYINSLTTTEGLYPITGNPGQFGYEIEVASTTHPPPIAIPQSVSLLENTTASITLTATEPDGDPLTYSVVTSPTSGFLTGTAPNLTYHPNANYTGPDAFSFKVNDGHVDSTPALVSITVTAPSAGLLIIPTFDSTILNDPNVVAITNTINSAIQALESKIADPVTVNILFAEMGSGLGQSSTYVSSKAYSSFYSALVADGKTTNDITALAHVTGGSSNPVNGGANISLTLPNLRALGFAADPPGGSDSTISLNMSLINITRTSIDPGKYDLKAVATHEMDEVLGSGSGLGAANIHPVDLFRRGAAGGVSFSTNDDDAYFSIDGGITLLARYNQNAGGDYGDWWSFSAHSPVRVQDAYGTPGTTPDLGVELTVLDVIGWDLVTSASSSAPQFQSASRSGNTFNFSWSSAAGRSYQVQVKTNLNQAAWVNFGSPILAIGSTTASSDTIGTNRQHYYRVGALPGPVAPPFNIGAQGPLGPITLETRTFLPMPARTAAPANVLPALELEATPWRAHRPTQ